jgi:hypothetical protein
MDISSGWTAQAAFLEIFVARKRLCQGFVLTDGIRLMPVSSIFQCIKRIAGTLFRFPESV